MSGARNSVLCFSFVLILSVLGCACEKPSNPKVASTSLALALDLQVDHAAVAEHFSDLKEEISLEKGKLKFKELQADELDTKTWCFMKYTIGESDWGLVPGTERDCTDDDDDDEKKRAKKHAKRWLAKATQAEEVRAEIDYLLTDGWYERALKVVGQTASSGFSFGVCVEDAIVVSTDLARRQAAARCGVLMDNEELNVVELLGKRGLIRLGIDLDDVDDEDVEKAMKKFLSKLGELSGADGAAFLMLVNAGWDRACFDKAHLDDDETARAMMMSSAVELCSEVAERLSKAR